MSVAFLSLGLVTAPFAQTRFPSTGTAWIIPGAWEEPTDRRTRKILPDATAVKQWEIAHADVAFGGDYGVAGNQQIDAIGYMYNQKLDFSPSETEMWYRRRAVAAGRNYEDYFLHFSEDTALEIQNPSSSSRTPFGRIPDTVGWTADPLHGGYWLYQNPPWDAPVWENADAGGALYVLLFERFDELTLQLSQPAMDGELRIEYPSAVDGEGLVSQWSELSFDDGTSNLSQNGVLRWTPPPDWEWAALHDGTGLSYGHGQFFGQSLLVNRGRMFALRLSWVDGSGTSQPRLGNLQLKDWMPEATPGDDSIRIIPGWDDANDVNSDGFVDEAEFAGRPNPNASARMRWESRVVPLGRMWSERSDWCRTNLFNATFRQEIGARHEALWNESGLRGGYNDDLFRTVGASEFSVVTGGAVAESPHRVDSDALLTAYTQGLVAVFAEISAATGSPWLTANISAENPFTEENRHAFLGGVGAYLREGYLHASQGLTGYFGLNKAWDIFAMAAADLRNIIQGQTRLGRARQLRNTKGNWQRDQEALLAQYYLLNVPGKTYFNLWNHSFTYGSNNTDSWLFYRAGIPKNVAYQPSGILGYDIGEPDGTIPEGFDALQYMVTTQAGGSYTIIGDSTDLVLSHPELLPAGEVPVVPSHIFHLQRSPDHPAVPGAPAESVLARRYTNGLVLYRTDMFGGNTDFMKSKRIRVTLPERMYRRVKRNGRRLTGCRSVVSLRGYEGAILVRDPRCEP
ncbi:MAG: hypothetical protein ABGY42_10440 [bacterium]